MFNKNDFISDAINVHILPNKLLSADVHKNELNIFNSINEEYLVSKLSYIIDYDPALFTDALNEICDNTVGNIMFRLLMTKMMTKHKKKGLENLDKNNKIKITNIGSSQQGRLLTKQKGSTYGNNTVKINLNLYDSSDIGIPERQYYFVTKDGSTIHKLKSVSGSIFHEFVHCLHDIEKTKTKVKTHDYWTNKEELRTISGYIPGMSHNTDDKIVSRGRLSSQKLGFFSKNEYIGESIYDPICDNCLNLYKSLAKEEPFSSRIGHNGFRNEDVNVIKRLENFYNNFVFDIAWPRIYVT
jgi:hypothetical protein